MKISVLLQKFWRLPKKERWKYTPAVTMWLNFFWGTIKFIFGILSHSYYVAIISLYSYGIGFAKWIGIKGYIDSHRQKREESYYYLKIVITLFITSAIYLLYMLLAFYLKLPNSTYNVSFSIVVGAFAIIEIIYSIRGFIISNHTNDLLLKAMKGVNIISALMALALSQNILYIIDIAKIGHHFFAYGGIIFGTLNIIVCFIMFRRYKLVKMEL